MRSATRPGSCEKIYSPVAIKICCRHKNSAQESRVISKIVADRASNVSGLLREILDSDVKHPDMRSAAGAWSGNNFGKDSITGNITHCHMHAAEESWVVSEEFRDQVGVFPTEDTDMGPAPHTRGTSPRGI